MSGKSGYSSYHTLMYFFHERYLKLLHLTSGLVSYIYYTCILLHCTESVLIFGV